MSKIITFIYEEAKKRANNNCVNRHACLTHIELDAFDMEEKIDAKKMFLPEKMKCYGCGKKVDRVHGNYVYSCQVCGNIFQKNRYLTASQLGKIAVVTGVRTKLGHQICLKLLRAGATVVGTTRFPTKALDMYREYSDFKNWEQCLHLYELDMDVKDMESAFSQLKQYILLQNFTKVDILINCAAQTIRHREKTTEWERHTAEEKNRYGDAKFMKKGLLNSWNMLLPDLLQTEMEELFRINAIAPVLLTKTLLDLLKQSERAFIINVHAKENLFNAHKTAKHMHTNMAKCALAMFTRILPEHNYVSAKTGKKFSIHGVDPGWISVDEYEIDSCIWITPPIDERDGAERVLYPIWKNRSSRSRTRRHFEKFSF